MKVKISRIWNAAAIHVNRKNSKSQIILLPKLNQLGGQLNDDPRHSIIADRLTTHLSIYD